MNDFLFTLLSFIVVLGVLVFVHELGHFLAAKWAGIHVFRFSIGIGSPIRRLTVTRNGTEYSISWLPLGGYVKMASQEEMAGDALEGARPEVEVPHEATFEAKPVWKRMVVILAGVTFNVLFAWIIYTGVLYGRGQPVLPITTIGRVIDTALPAGAEALATLAPGDRITAVNDRAIDTWEGLMQGIQAAPGDTIVLGVAGRDPVRLTIHHDALKERSQVVQSLLPWLPPQVGQAVPGRPAARAGLAPGDTVLALDGEPIAQWDDMVAALATRGGIPVVLSLGTATGRREVELTPDAETVPANGGERTVGRIGVYQRLPESRYEPLSFGQAVVAGGRATVNTTNFIVGVVRGLLSGRVSSREVGGPIAIGQIAGEAARAGPVEFLMFMAVISVNLAIINLLPIPVLDGGQFLFLLGEAVIRRPLPARLRQRLTAVGLLLLLLLMVLAFSNDIRRLLGL